MNIDDVTLFLTSFTTVLSEIFLFLIFARVIISWFRPSSNFFTEFIITSTDPIMQVAKKITPRTGFLDFSPIVAILGLNLLTYILLFLVIYISNHIKNFI